MKAEKIILGIDPGTNVMGYGVLKVVDNKASLVVMGIIDMRKERDPYLRLGKIFYLSHTVPFSLLANQQVQFYFDILYYKIKYCHPGNGTQC